MNIYKVSYCMPNAGEYVPEEMDPVVGGTGGYYKDLNGFQLITAMSKTQAKQAMKRALPERGYITKCQMLVRIEELG